MITNHISAKALANQLLKITVHKHKILSTVGKIAQQPLLQCTTFGLGQTRTHWLFVKDFLEEFVKVFGPNALLNRRFVDLCIELPTADFEPMIHPDDGLPCTGCRAETVLTAYSQALTVLLCTPALTLRHGIEIAALFDVARCTLYKPPLEAFKPERGLWSVYPVYEHLKALRKEASTRNRCK